MKKCLSIFLSLIFLCGLLALPAQAVGFTPTYDVQAEAAYVVNTDTNIIVYEKNCDTPLIAASLTKLLNLALLLTDHLDELDSVEVTMPSSIYDYVYGSSTADIRAGEVLSLRELMYAMMLPSSNEAACAVAYYYGDGNMTGYVNQMNALAQRIGCTGTTVYDACGLDEGNVTTAKDMYLILRYLLSFDVYREVAGSYTHDMPANVKHASSYTIISTNKLLSSSGGGSYYRSYNQGGKTGTLGSGWQNYASFHSQNGENYISVVLHSPDSCDPSGYPTLRPALYETGQIMDWVYSSFSIQAALDTGEPIHEIPVKYASETDTLMLFPSDSIMTILPVDNNGSVTQKIFDLPEDVAAPVHRGDVIGTVTLSLAGEVIGSCDLIAGQDVARNQLLYVVARIGDFFASLYFRVLLVLAAIAVFIYLVWFVQHSIKNHNTNKVRRRHY